MDIKLGVIEGGVETCEGEKGRYGEGSPRLKPQKDAIFKSIIKGA